MRMRQDLHHPFRTPPAATEAPLDPDVQSEERVLHTLLVLVGLIPIALAAVAGNGAGVQATLGGLMVATGIAGLVGGAAPAARRE